MRCAYPITVTGTQAPCRQCMPCRINQKRMLTGRILLEAAHTPLSSTFLTLTYNDDHLPKGESLVPKDVTKFIDRCRRGSLGHFRYYVVGEYGEKTQRPHYHMALFGVPPSTSWDEYLRDKWNRDPQNPRKQKEIGFTKVGDITKESAAYIAGYVTKKLNATNPALNGRYPEFARFSKNPPLGAAGIRHIYDLLHTRTGARAVETMGDVPNSFEVQGKQYPIGTYWKTKLREWMGITNPPLNSNWELHYEAFTKEDEAAKKKHAHIWQSKTRYNPKGYF